MSVKPFETTSQDCFCASSYGSSGSCGLLIQTVPGNRGGVGALLMKRSGWEA